MSDVSGLVLNYTETGTVMNPNGSSRGIFRQSCLLVIEVACASMRHPQSPPESSFVQGPL